MATITITDKNPSRNVKYSMDDRLAGNIDNVVIPSLRTKDKDFVFCIDGGEGTGKSTLALQMGRKIDPTLDLERVVFDPEAFRNAVLKAKKGQVIVYDEAFTGFSSRSSLSGINRALVSLAMQMRQKNLCIIIVLPTIFLLDKYLALFRTKVLIHVYENKGVRGYFRVYPQKLKKFLIMSGVKTYSYKVKSNFKGRFYGVFALGDKKEEDKYRKKKEKALADTQNNPMTAGQVRYRQQRDLLVWFIHKNMKLTYRELEELLKSYDFDMSYVQIRKIVTDFGDKTEEIDDLKSKHDEIVQKEEEIEENDEKIEKFDDFDENYSLDDGEDGKNEGV